MWTNVSKPVGAGYTKLNTAKPSYDESGLIYDDPNSFYDGYSLNAYINISKPSSSSYTKISKPI